jgi:hypothetical protein
MKRENYIIKSTPLNFHHWCFVLIKTKNQVGKYFYYVSANHFMQIMLGISLRAVTRASGIRKSLSAFYCLTLAVISFLTSVPQPAAPARRGRRLSCRGAER